MEIKGLSLEEVEKRKREGKQNIIKEVEKKTGWDILASHIFTLFNALNLVLAFFVFITGRYRNMLFMGTVVINTVIGTVQEFRARHFLNKLRITSQPQAKVLRDGKEELCSGEDIVLDDIIHLTSGDEVLVDSTILEGSIRVNEALLTGEGDPISKEKGDSILGGSFVISGSAYAIASAVGDDSYTAGILKEIRKEKRQPSRLRDALNFILKNITFIMVPLGIILFLRQRYITALPVNDSLLGTVASVVGMMPEGLVLLTSVALNVGSILLSRESTLVKEMYSLETLARCDTFSIDKTGTITTGKMKVIEYINYSDKDVTNIIANIVHASLEDNPTSLAIKKEYPLKEKIECTHFEPFSSMVKKTIFESADHRYELGAYEFLDCIKEEKIEADMKKAMSQGYRIIALSEDRHIIALFLLQDELRKSARETLKYIQDQGVDLKVISGDHPNTVSALLRQLDYPKFGNYLDCSKVTNEELKHLCININIFGRCTPEQKEIIIDTLQENGHTVGMMGDGINDILALRKADFSIALSSGVESLKDVANVVLTDDDFAHIPSIIRQGRRVINNIQRTATLFLTKTGLSVLLTICTILFLKEYPFEPIQLTLVSSLCIGLPSFVLSFEPKYSRISGSFLANVLRKSLPCSISIVASICVLRLLRHFGLMDISQFETISVFITAGSLIYLIYTISLPLTPLRISLIVIAFAGILTAYFFLPQLFSFTALGSFHLFITILMILFSILLTRLLQITKIADAFSRKIDELY